MFKNKVLLITGGTGSFGNAILERFLETDIDEIRIFSRDELKQDDMRKKYRNDKLKFYLGDVRDVRSIKDSMYGVDYVFHAAALKQVPSCEFYPMQAVQTNIIGTENILNAAIDFKVKKLIALSTDKAVYPINSMGISKSMMERLVIAKGRTASNTTIACTRYGNVIASRGSVIPNFIRQIELGIPLTITNPDMTRFMMSLDDAVELVLYAFENAKNGDIFVQKAPAASIKTLANVIINLKEKPNYPMKIIGTRHGEKLYETLLTNEEMAKSEDLGRYFRIPADQRDLNYDKYFSEGVEIISGTNEYHSHNTEQLDEDKLALLLKNIKEVKILLGNL
jgi:UDP-N-acetylglucosamine 4,6-dehydratase